MSSIKSVHEDRRRSKFQEQLIVMLQLVFHLRIVKNKHGRIGYQILSYTVY